MPLLPQAALIPAHLRAVRSSLSRFGATHTIGGSNCPAIACVLYFMPRTPQLRKLIRALQSAKYTKIELRNAQSIGKSCCNPPASATSSRSARGCSFKPGLRPSGSSPVPEKRESWLKYSWKALLASARVPESSEDGTMGCSKCPDEVWSAARPRTRWKLILQEQTSSV